MPFLAALNPKHVEKSGVLLFTPLTHGLGFSSLKNTKKRRKKAFFRVFRVFLDPQSVFWRQIEGVFLTREPIFFGKISFFEACL